MKMVASLCAALALLAGTAAADDYPSRPITVVVPYAPGGTTDLSARLVLKHMETVIGQPMIVDNRAGASGAIGASIVAQAKADGYTLMYDNIGILTMNQHLSDDLPYDPDNGFTMIGRVITAHQAVLVGPTVKANTIEELMAELRANPGQYRYGSGGMGTGLHIFTEAFKAAAGVDMEHVPYKSSGPALVGLMSGETEIGFEGSANALAHVQAGKLRALAVTSKERDPLYPDVPTLAEAAVPGFSVQGWSVLSGPAGLSDDIVAKLNAALNETLANEAVIKQLDGFSIKPTPSTPQEAAEFIASERAYWGKIIKDANITIN